MRGGTNAITDAITYAFLVAGILVLTRTGSGGANFVKASGSAVTGLVQASSGQTVTG
jgi:hypothetical protein